jgi:hypothetical protein
MGIARARLISAPQITREFLQGWLGQSVEDFCPNRGGDFGNKGDPHNHCAHFVSHALGFQIGKLCHVMTFLNRNKPETGRSLVVNDIFNACPSRGLWDEKPATLDACLIFAVAKNGIGQQGGQWVMGNVPRKHVGIHLTGECYNYHNTHNEGVAVDGPGFFKKLYGPNTVALYGTFPT